MANSIMETIRERKPKVFSKPTVFFDVDDTLVMWDEKLKGDTVCINCDGHLNHMVINKLGSHRHFKFGEAYASDKE
jgi:hypothetical protein